MENSKKKTNYNQIRILKQKKMVELAKNYPDLKPKSGIYMFYRCVAYIGKSSEKHGILGRCAMHCISHDQHIDNSIASRKMSYEGGQWYVKPLIYCQPEDVDKQEREFIEKYNGTFELLNTESGGTSGKGYINERKERKGYSTGLKNGREQTRKEIAHLFDKHLDVVIKGEPNKLKERAKAKFEQFLSGNDKN